MSPHGCLDEACWFCDLREKIEVQWLVDCLRTKPNPSIIQPLTLTILYDHLITTYSNTKNNIFPPTKTQC